MGWLDSLTQVDSTLLDARGRCIKIQWDEFDREIRTDLDSGIDKIPDSEERSRYERRLRQVQSIWYHVLMSGLIVLLGSAPLLTATLMFPHLPVRALFFGAVGVTVLVVAWRHPRWSKRQVWVMRCRLMGSDRCFGCGYSMIRAKPESDGCVVCPAWRVAASTDGLDIPEQAHPDGL